MRFSVIVACSTLLRVSSRIHTPISTDPCRPLPAPCPTTPARLRWQINARTRTGQSGTFDGISVYRLDRHGRVHTHEVTDVQLRDPVRLLPLIVSCRLAGGRALAAAGRRGGRCAQRHVMKRRRCPRSTHAEGAPPHPSTPPLQPITNPLFWGLNFVLSPRPALSPTPCPGSWYADGEEGLPLSGSHE